jgi:hypothetical protein
VNKPLLYPTLSTFHPIKRLPVTPPFSRRYNNDRRRLRTHTSYPFPTFQRTTLLLCELLLVPWCFVVHEAPHTRRNHRGHSLQQGSKQTEIYDSYTAGANEPTRPETHQKEHERIYGTPCQTPLPGDWSSLHPISKVIQVPQQGKVSSSVLDCTLFRLVVPKISTNSFC